MSIKLTLTAAVFFLSTVATYSQKAARLLNGAEALRIESVLAADDMKGRKPGTPEIDRAADFIAAEFKKSGLKFYTGLNSFRQSFKNVRTRLISATASVDGTLLETNNIFALTGDSVLNVTEASGFQKISVGNTDKLLDKASEIIAGKKNTIVLVDPFFSKEFNKLRRFKRDGERMPYHIIFLLSNAKAETYDIKIRNTVTEFEFTNVIGVIPGKSRKDEFVVFSGHYDHLGTTKPNALGDSVFNGANDDAAGTTGVMMLANYFANLNNNERTLVFVAFTAEESGGFGSQYFSKNIDAEKVMAMFNLEMIGTESKWGKNSAYITGFEKSDFGVILQNNLKGSAFKFEPDPYPSQNLFYRSDNATLAALGVPAHTISTSKMDSEPNYHRVSDEVATLDMDNMAEVIRAVALSSVTIISGKDTPTRVEKK